ncbi:MAG TPA: fibronectin type III domain-containing protein [Xanthomonadaceae bacterium]|nr:fibronectin type III domain-containing protein [Xanthomonadaceae bacterium]
MNILDNNSAVPATTAAAPGTTTPAPGPKSLLAKLAIGFVGRSTDAALIAGSMRIITSLTGNANFPAPQPTVASLQAAHDAFVAMVAVLDRGNASIAKRNAARAPLQGLLRELALYVQQTSQGNRVILLSSGYPLQKSRQPTGIPAAPQNLRLKQGNSGSLIARCAIVPGVVSYQWRYATNAAPAAYVMPNPTGKSNCTITSLTPGTQYVVQARAIGRKGTSDWSAGAMLFVN